SGAERWILARELMWELGDAALVGDERPDDLVAPALQMLERLKQELVPLRRLDEWADSADDAERAALMHACVRLFRAYELECLERFLDRFPNARSVALGKNQRSSARIVAAAAALIGNNSERLAKELSATRSGRRVVLWRCADRMDEAAAIAAEARRLAESGVSLAEIAVLCRTNAIATPGAAAL